MASVVERLLQGVEDLCAATECVGEGFGADGQDHEFLEVDRVVGMGAAIDDVHHRRRQDVRVGAADIAIERKRRGLRRGLGHRHRDAEDRIGAEAGFVRRAVEFDHHGVDVALVGRVEAEQLREDLVIDGSDGLEDALAEVTRLVAVAELDRFVSARGGARGDGGAARRAIFQRDFGFDGRVAPAVEDFAGVDVDDLGHGRSLRWA